jgi:DNA excision repair protein ERCC-3
MEYYPDRPLVVQSDRTLFLEVNHPQFEEIRDQLLAFAELIKSPEYVHTYRMTPLSLWNAAASGWNAGQVLDLLKAYVKFPISYAVEHSIAHDMGKFGRLCLMMNGEELLLYSDQREYIEKLATYASFSSFFIGEIRQEEIDEKKWWTIGVQAAKRGELKQQSIRLGFPIRDEAGYIEGDKLALTWEEKLPNGEPFELREYQLEAAEAFYKQGSHLGGHGVLVLPCGAGKTIIGMASIVNLQCATLILTTNTTSVKQWKREIIEKTSLTQDQVGEYTGEMKQIRPVTIATYQVLTYRSNRTADFQHMQVFQERNWGLVIYDEVHLLPAPIFRATASIQSTRRLGLTATLVREDGREEDVFSLVGPKRYDVPWKQLEHQGFIATAYCTEVRVDFDSFLKEKYYVAPARKQIRIAQENPNKIPVVQRLLEKHKGLSTLIIGQYVDQLEDIGVILQVPVITGKMKQGEREVIYQRFKQGEIPVLAVSKVANFAIDLPDASVAIQISGTYGSRQEEAQRLGRILRPKKEHNEAYFYNVVTKESKDQEYALKRQLFLVEQGYRYQLMEEVTEEIEEN